MLRFDPEAADAFRQLRKDDSRSELFTKVREYCHELDSGHGRTHLRRPRFTNPSLWYITMGERDDTWVILWESVPSDPSDAVIRCLGPASFA